MKKLLILGQIPKEYGGSYTTGVANVILEIAEKLSGSYDVYIYATNFQSKSPLKKGNITFLGYSKPLLLKLLAKEVMVKPFKVIKELVNYKKEFGVPMLKSFFYRILIKNYIDQFNPELINAHGMIFSAVLKHLKLSERVFFSFHGFMHDDQNSIAENKSRGIAMQKMYYNGAKYVNRAIYLTPEMRDKGIDNLKIQAYSTTIIPNGVNIEKFKYSVEARKELREEFSINDQEKIFISVGALTNRKNHLGFIDFLKHNKFKGNYWIIGKVESEETRDRILEIAKKEQLSFNIKLFSYVPHNDLYKYYSAADIYAHPSTSEGQALVVFEAMCCGMPVVVNKDIEGTVALDNSFDEYLRFVNLKKDSIPDFIIDRIKLSEKCKSELSWQETARKYINLFENHG